MPQSIVTIGSFDGVHMGHRHLIKEFKEKAALAQANELLISFSPHPQFYFHKRKDFRLLNADAEKIEILDRLGLQNVLILHFTEEIARQTAREFLENTIKNQINAKGIVFGHDHKLGKEMNSSFDFYRNICHDLGLKAYQEGAFQLNGQVISSSKIRHELAFGNISLANEYLGYDYFLEGQVVHGKKLGKKLGYPTANLEVNEALKLIPQMGVYAIRVKYDGKIFDGMGSIGVRPTINGDSLTIEANLFDFDKEIYGESIRIYFVKKMRNEEKYDSIEALKNQLKKDKENAMSILLAS